MKILKKLFPIIGLIYFGLTCYGQTRGVSYDPTTTNVIQTVNQKFHAITNLAGTASTIAGYDANKKLGTISASAARTILEVPIFDSTDPGAANIFPFWDDAQNEVDWTSSGALRTLLGLDTNDDVTFGTVTATTVTATTLAGAGGGITYNGAGNNGNLGIGVNTLQELNDAVDNLNLGEGGGSAPEGTMVNSGASTQYSFTYYTDTTGTNMAASLISTDSTLTNLLAGGVKANVLVLTNISESLSNIGLGTEDSPQFTAIELNHASANTLSASGGNLTIEGNTLAKGAQAITFSGPTAARTVTLPDANFTVARTDAANTFTGVQTMTAPVFVTKVQLPTAAGSSTLSTGGDAAVNTTGKVIGVHNGTKEVAVPLIYSKEISFDPDAVCDGAVDRLFLFTVGAWAPNGITITRWRCSFEADPTTEVDLDLKRADAFIGVANSAVMDVLDTTAGVSTETTAANINGGAVVATGKVIYLEFGTAYTESNHQIIFEIEYEIEED